MMKYILILITFLLVTSGLQAQQNPLDQLAQDVQRAAQQQGQINREREAQFVRERNRQRELLAQARNELSNQRRISDTLQTEFDENEVLLSQLETTLDERLGNLGELFGVVRQVAGDLQGILDDSMVSAQIEGRGAFMADLAQRRELATGAELNRFFSMMVTEIAEQGKIVKFNTTIRNADGREETNQDVVRVGVFNAISNGRFLQWDSGEGVMQAISRQPAGRYQTMAQNLQSASPGQVETMAVDFTRGTILSLVVQEPDLMERIRQGKQVGYVIIGLGILGFLFGLWKGVSLFLKGSAIKRQLKRDQPDKGNALGRVMSVYTDNQDADIETLELKLDEAILRETAPLESGLSFIKVLYVIAPLLGLLGTVVGMIETFQQITLFGTGDPRMMAGGISAALITTTQGLIVAIPLTILHSLLQSRSRSLIQILEEQAAGIISRLAEKYHGGS